MHEIGIVEFVQIQKEPLKQYVGEKRVYTPDLITRVDYIEVEQDGIHGYLASGERMIDAHHRHHPRSRFNGRNGISLGFVHEYEQIQNRFGNHLPVGVAGENIVIRMTDIVPLPETLQVINAQGEVLNLMEIRPAPPCVEFSQFCANRTLTPLELKETLQFLDDGRRGYYTEVRVETPFKLMNGDRLVIP